MINFSLNQLAKPTIYHNYKTQDKVSRLCRSYCLYFIYINERMSYYDAILKMYFEYLNNPINVFDSSPNNSEDRIDTSFYKNLI